LVSLEAVRQLQLGGCCRYPPTELFSSLAGHCMASVSKGLGDPSWAVEKGHPLWDGKT